MNRRNTIQKSLILAAVKSMSNHPTADEIYDVVSAQCPGISKATVYRNLNLLAEEGSVLRVAVANAPDRYDKTAYDHCHLCCLSCGRVFDYELLYDVKPDSERNPGFIVYSYELILRGICPSCNKEKTLSQGGEQHG